MFGGNLDIIFGRSDQKSAQSQKTADKEKKHRRAKNPLSTRKDLSDYSDSPSRVYKTKTLKSRDDLLSVLGKQANDSNDKLMRSMVNTSAFLREDRIEDLMEHQSCCESEHLSKSLHIPSRLTASTMEPPPLLSTNRLLISPRGPRPKLPIAFENDYYTTKSKISMDMRKYRKEIKKTMQDQSAAEFGRSLYGSVQRPISLEFSSTLKMDSNTMLLKICEHLQEKHYLEQELVTLRAENKELKVKNTHLSTELKKLQDTHEVLEKTLQESKETTGNLQKKVLDLKTRLMSCENVTNDEEFLTIQEQLLAKTQKDLEVERKMASQLRKDKNDLELSVKELKSEVEKYSKCVRMTGKLVGPNSFKSLFKMEEMEEIEKLKAIFKKQKEILEKKKTEKPKETENKPETQKNPENEEKTKENQEKMQLKTPGEETGQPIQKIIKKKKKRELIVPGDHNTCEKFLRIGSETKIAFWVFSFLDAASIIRVKNLSKATQALFKHEFFPEVIIAPRFKQQFEKLVRKYKRLETTVNIRNIFEASDESMHELLLKYLGTKVPYRLGMPLVESLKEVNHIFFDSKKSGSLTSIQAPQPPSAEAGGGFGFFQSFFSKTQESLNMVSAPFGLQPSKEEAKRKGGLKIIEGNSKSYFLVDQNEKQSKSLDDILKYFKQQKITQVLDETASWAEFKATKRAINAKKGELVPSKVEIPGTMLANLLDACEFTLVEVLELSEMSLMLVDEYQKAVMGVYETDSQVEEKTKQLFQAHFNLEFLKNKCKKLEAENAQLVKVNNEREEKMGPLEMESQLARTIIRVSEEQLDETHGKLKIMVKEVHSLPQFQLPFLFHIPTTN